MISDFALLEEEDDDLRICAIYDSGLCNKKGDGANFEMRMHAHWFCPHQSFSSVLNFTEILENSKLSKVANLRHKIYIQLNFMEEIHARRGISRANQYDIICIQQLF